MLTSPSLAPSKARSRSTYSTNRESGFFSWPPLIVYPDFIANTAGGWQSSKMDDADKNLFPRLVQRLADDIRVRLGAAAAWASGSRVGSVACPKHLR